MENAEEVFHFLEEFSKRKPKTIPQELNDYLAYVARTGDPVYQWSLVKSLFKEKLLNVITDFYESTPSIEIPPYPNVDPFNYDIMKNSLLERLDTFTSAPFTVQRICELLTYPRKQYNRVDKFMRAIEKNILVVSTREPGLQRHVEQENGEPAEPMVNGSDNNSEYNVDVEMEDLSWKENTAQQQSSEPQPGSSDSHINVEDIEARLQAKQDAPMDTQEKKNSPYESVTPPEPNTSMDQITETKSNEAVPTESESTTVVACGSDIAEASDKTESTEVNTLQEPKTDIDIKTDSENTNAAPLVIPEIKVEDAEMTEQRLNEEAAATFERSKETTTEVQVEKEPSPEVVTEDTQQSNVDESLESNVKEEIEPKLISEVSTSSEESSSSSDHTDGNSNSPKPENETNIDIQEESSETNLLEEYEPKKPEVEKAITVEQVDKPEVTMQSDNYSISDVNSELPQTSPEQELKTDDIKENSSEETKKEPKTEDSEFTNEIKSS